MDKSRWISKKIIQDRQGRQDGQGGFRKTDNPSLKNNKKTNRYHREKRGELIVSRKSSPPCGLNIWTRG